MEKHFLGDWMVLVMRANIQGCSCNVPAITDIYQVAEAAMCDCVCICLWYTHSSKLQGLGQGPFLPWVHSGIKFQKSVSFSWVYIPPGPPEKNLHPLVQPPERQGQPWMLCLGAIVWIPTLDLSAADHHPITCWPLWGYLYFPLESADLCFPRFSWQSIFQSP